MGSSPNRTEWTPNSGEGWEMAPPSPNTTRGHLWEIAPVPILQLLLIWDEYNSTASKLSYTNWSVGPIFMSDGMSVGLSGRRVFEKGAHILPCPMFVQFVMEMWNWNCSHLFSWNSNGKFRRHWRCALSRCSYSTKLTRCLPVFCTTFNIIWNAMNTARLFFWGTISFKCNETERSSLLLSAQL